MEKTVNKLISGNDIEFTDNLLEFTKIYEKQLTFDELNRDELRERLWESIFNHLQQAKYFTIHQRCLQALRILGRDKTNLNEMITQQRLNVIIKNAGLSNPARIARQTSSDNVFATAEALKLLCNLLYNSTSVQSMIGETVCLECIIARLRLYNVEDLNDVVMSEIALFDTRILFLTTALNIKLRTFVSDKLSGKLHLIEMLEKLTENILSSKTNNQKDDDAIALMCEILKVLFNLYINSDESTINDQKDIDKKLALILYKLLVDEQSIDSTKEKELESNIINLLTVTPYDSYDSMIQPILDDTQESMSYKNMNMGAIARLLKFLDEKSDFDGKELKSRSLEQLSPVITALIRLVKTERLIRKYVRLQILPPLKDVMKRPEEGTTLRAKLCKLLTCPLVELCDLVAELIFLLCKENASRMVKYTGYGNAAGMFANKGLLGRGQQVAAAAAAADVSNKSGASTVYSSDSEDSDTEEYVKYKENINPVTGCYENPKINPLDGMSEEQKEYEAMKLVALVDQLTRQGVVQPCRIGDDGKPIPIEHILELQEELPKLNVNNEKQ